MPRSSERTRGGVIRYRTIQIGKKSKRKYAHVAIVRKPGKRGGRTILGKIRQKK
jgi:hypothetical protein